MKKSSESNTAQELSARLQDWIKQCARRQTTVCSCFFTPLQQSQLKPYLPKDELYWQWDGGCQMAERKKLILAYDKEELISDVVCLTAHFNNKFVTLSHRDVLGALMSLDLDRSQFGDCWVEPQRIVLYTQENLANYVMANLHQINRLTVQFEQSSMKYEPLIEKESFSKTVTGLRLDCLVAALCNLSRAKAQELIRHQSVSVNHEILDDCSVLCHNEDTISVRGTGRFVLKGQRGVTRKDRIVVEFEKFV